MSEERDKFGGLLTEVDLDLSELENEDLLQGRAKLMKSDDLFLGIYDLENVTELLEQSGLLPGLQTRGFNKLEISLETKNTRDQRLYIKDKKTRENLVFMRMHLGSFYSSEQTLPMDNMHLLFIDWLLLQNINADNIEPDKLFPGQKYPGLGLFKEVKSFVLSLTENKYLDGVANIPEFYHDAVLFRDRFQFLKPESQAMFDTVSKQLKKLGLKKLSLMISEEKIRMHHRGKAEDQVFKFMLGEMVAAKCPELLHYFESDLYHKRYKNFKKHLKFYVQE